MAATRRTVHVVPHFRFRALGCEDQRTCVRRAFELVRQFLAACRQDEAYHLVLSELDYLQPFLAVHGEEREFVRQLVAAGRLQLGGSYSQPDEMVLQGEAIIRNLIYGRLYHEGLLKGRPDVYLALVSSGQCVQLPQLLARAGFEAMVRSDESTRRPRLCIALAPDGSEVLENWQPQAALPASREEVAAAAEAGFQAEAALGISHHLRLLGGDMAPPVDWLAQSAEPIDSILSGLAQQAAERGPAIVISTPHHYLMEVKAEADRAAIPLASPCGGSSHHVGAVGSRSDLNTANRLAENCVLDAETWATLASLVGARFPHLALDKAWRQILFGQQPGAVSGGCSEVSFLDLLACYQEALELAGEVEERSLAYLAGSIEATDDRRLRGTVPLVVFNSMGWERTDVCQARVELTGPLAQGFRLLDDRGREAPAQLVRRSQGDEKPCAEIAFVASSVPSVGYRTYYLAPAGELPLAATMTSGEATIENEHLALRADARSGLISIYGKRERREYLNPALGPANVVIARADHQAYGDAVRSSERTARVSALKGQVFSQLKILGELPGKCELHQEITLYRGLPRIDLRTILAGYPGERELLALAFPLSVGGGATFEDRFASVVRSASCGLLDSHGPEESDRSACAFGVAQNWVDVGPVPSVMIGDGPGPTGAVPLGPCAIVGSANPEYRAPVRALMQALLRRGITSFVWPDTEAATCSPYGFAISLGRRNAYSQNVLARVPGADQRLEEAMRGREWGAVLLSGADPAGEGPAIPVLVADTARPEGISRLAAALAAAVEGDRLQIPSACDLSGLARPRDDCGVALLNRGALGAGLQPDGTLVSLLAQTASQAAQPSGEGKAPPSLVPARQSHVFEHALLPHRGDWREAGVVRAGYEFNRPLRAVVKQAEVTADASPGLPAQFSFVSMDAPNVIVAAVKPLGNPIADRRAAESSAPEREVVVRLYEATGSAAEVQVSFGAGPAEAWLADLMEHTVSEVRVGRAGRAFLRPRRGGPGLEPASAALSVSASEVVTLAARWRGCILPARRGSEGEDLGPTAEPVSPTFCRYWEQNPGAAPMGNQPVTVWLSGPVPIGQNTRFALGLSNDYRDREISGRVHLLAPPECQLLPREVPYRVPAGSQAVYEAMVIVPPETPPCFLRAVVEDDGRTVQDVIEVGRIAPLEVSLRRASGQFALEVRNPNPDLVEGQVALVTPLEWWGRAAGSLALGAVEPRQHALRLAAGEGKRFLFRVTGNEEGLWAAAKLMWYGRVQYVPETRAG